MAAAYMQEGPAEKYQFGLLFLLLMLRGIPMSQLVELLPSSSAANDALLGERTRLTMD
jgi:hypothetical protein